MVIITHTLVSSTNYRKWLEKNFFPTKITICSSEQRKRWTKKFSDALEAHFLCRRSPCEEMWLSSLNNKKTYHTLIAFVQARSFSHTVVTFSTPYLRGHFLLDGETGKFIFNNRLVWLPGKKVLSFCQGWHKPANALTIGPPALLYWKEKKTFLLFIPPNVAVGQAKKERKRAPPVTHAHITHVQCHVKECFFSPCEIYVKILPLLLSYKYSLVFFL